MFIKIPESYLLMLPNSRCESTTGIGNSVSTNHQTTKFPTNDSPSGRFYRLVLFLAEKIIFDILKVAILNENLSDNFPKKDFSINYFFQYLRARNELTESREKYILLHRKRE